MTRAVHRRLRPLAFASRHLLLRPAGIKNCRQRFVLTLLALGLYSLGRGSYPLPASTLARALLAPQEMGEQPRFILFDIRLPRILMALLCGAMLGLAGAAMQGITRNGLADPGLIGVKARPRGPGAGAVFPEVGLVWRPLAGMVGGIAVALLVLTLARDCSRPRFILIGIGVSWSLAAAVGIFMTTADVRDVQTAMIWLAGSLQAATWPLLAVASWALPGAIILFCTARAADVALLGNGPLFGLGVRLQQLTVLRSRAGAADLGQRLLHRRPGICGPDGAAYGALRAARRPGIAAVRQRAHWRLAGAGDRYPWPAGAFAPAADPGGDCHCSGRLPVLRCLALASPVLMPLTRKVVCVGSSHCCCC